ncbi:uncharacterized protein LOC122267900 [Penaeus japonicus]|uniref:uncharacterized protein LOC122267900 n=1 Tax=Penaeus japonicus TaxID=27405 RepID=UPI001C71244A|nr:uncharacterized protein LOC122267900 [Penaeus japonicus]
MVFWAVACAFVVLTGNRLGSYAMMPDVPTLCTFPALPGAKRHVLGRNVVAWTCGQANTTWSTGDVVLLRTCEDNLSALPSCVPVSPTSEGIKPCADAPPVPANAVLKYQFGHNGSSGRYYECKEKSGWMFGVEGRLTQCLKGKWTPIRDVCDEDCKMPQNCNQLVELGFKESGTYRIVPSGVQGDLATPVWCDLGGKGSKLRDALSAARDGAKKLPGSVA